LDGLIGFVSQHLAQFVGIDVLRRSIPAHLLQLFFELIELAQLLHQLLGLFERKLFLAFKAVALGRDFFGGELFQEILQLRPLLPRGRIKAVVDELLEVTSHRLGKAFEQRPPLL
jgi:hypothetical protein